MEDKPNASDQDLGWQLTARGEDSTRKGKMPNISWGITNCGFKHMAKEMMSHEDQPCQMLFGYVISMPVVQP